MQLDTIPGLGIKFWVLPLCLPRRQHSPLGQNPPIWGLGQHPPIWGPGQLVWLSSAQAERGLALNAVLTSFLCFPEKL